MALNLSPTQIAFNARGDGKFSLPFQEQIDFFRQKLNLPTEAYDDILKAAHDRAFVVAGATKADLLNDLRGAVDKAIADGKSIHWFRKEFAAIVQKQGWEGWTGSDTKAGRDWRTRVIYNTNIMSSYSAGRYAQLHDPDLLKARPYWKYIHNDTVANPRPLHLSWNGKVLHHTDPWWKVHYPPNGWGCRCRVTAVRASEFKGDKAPNDGTYTKTDRDGVTHTVPKGVDYGWDYAPGASRTTPLKDLIDQKLMRFPAEIGAEMWQVLKPVLKAEQLKAVQDMVATASASMMPAGAGVIAHVMEPETVSALKNYDVDLSDAAIWLRDHELIHAIRETKAGRGAALPLDAWLNLPEHLESAVAYFDKVNKNVIYAFDLPGVVGKVAVELNKLDKVRDAGVRRKITSNFIVTGGIVKLENMQESRYVPLNKQP
ncbi:MAG: phage minor head protein [Methylobacter sp.]|nr:phage minor head protein [Methylobacter sp.]MDP2169637.1 phage minor head protein [Rhodocyclaceae bacterium]MDP2429051.1 phage minor head protein [Methylobacter sp.]MDP3056552.1 phage minor head protein [Methylobacter sp.]MDP3362041.1 phage minor head protein [Methylobacter sp.]